MSDHYLRSARLSLVLVACASLMACQSWSSTNRTLSGLVTPYKMDIVQGNFVSKEQVAAIQPGMSRTQVRNILGTPLLASMFHADRWDYVFTFVKQGLEPQSRKVTVYFKGDLLERIDADDLPSEAEFVASLDSGRKLGKVPVLEASEEDLKKFPAPANPAGQKAPLPAAPASYPPLEPAAR